MRIHVKIATSARELPWEEVQRPGRALLYGLLRQAAPELGERLHTGGLRPYGLSPLGHGVPIFPDAPRRRGVYAAGGQGSVEFGSPMPAVIEAFAKGMANRSLVDWGGVALQVRSAELVEPPEFASGRATFRTVTPVVMKGSGKNDAGERTTRQAWLLPQDIEFPVYFLQNLRRKATTLGFGEEIHLDAITSVGPKRSFAIKGGKKVGATVQVNLSGEPAILKALWSWGLGQGNAAGFGWVSA
jgi:CRISPR-associated endoribonuclease Cas6